VTYAALRGDDRASGYIAAIVVIALTAIPGVLMFLKWREGRRPGATRGSARVEDRLPRPIVYFHGFGAATTAVLAIVLLVVD
jgi:hypothetical protein